MQMIFDHSQNETDTIRTFFFKKPENFEYTAGQYIQISLPHENADDRGHKRWFTLSSSPTDDLLSITTRFNNERSSTFKQTLFSLAPGTEISFTGPLGDFVLPKHVQTPLVFVAGGIGITPFHSMMEWLATTGENRPIQFLYAVRNEDDIIFQDTFAKAGVHATIVVDDPSPSWGGERGRLSAELILGLEKPADNTLVYVSGPEPLVEMLEADLKKAGLKPEQLVLDFFPNYPAA